MEFWRVESGEMADLLWTGSLLALGILLVFAGHFLVRTPPPTVSRRPSSRHDVAQPIAVNGDRGGEPCSLQRPGQRIVGKHPSILRYYRNHGRSASLREICSPGVRRRVEVAFGIAG